MKKLGYISSLGLFILFVSSIGCSTYTAIDPVGKGRVRFNGSVGGPFFTNLAPVPMPYAMAGVTYGLEHNMNLTANVHLLPIPYGIGGADLSFAWFPVLNDSAFVPNVSIQPSLSFMFSANPNPNIKERVALFPYVSSAVSWKLWIGTIYAGLDVAVNSSLLPPFRPRVDSAAEWIFVSPFIGYRWNISSKVKFITEVKFLAINAKTDNLAIDYVSMGGIGTVAPFLGVQVEF